MALKFNKLSHSSASGDQPQPPFGAPTGHFGDKTDNIQREALAATSDLGQAVFGVDAGGAAHDPGDLPATQSSTAATGGPTSTEINQLKAEFAQIMYDLTWRPGDQQGSTPTPGDIRALSSTAGLSNIQVNALLVPTNVTATWVPCDGTDARAPNLSGKVIYGADPRAGIPVNGGASVASTLDAEESLTGLSATQGHTLAVTEMPAHNHTQANTGNDGPDHAHAGGVGTVGTRSVGTTGSQVSVVNSVGTTNTQGATARHAHAAGVINNRGGGLAHSHGITDVTHDHAITGAPEGVTIEYWMRIA